MNYDIFLSYRRADQELASALVEALEARGVGVWWDQKIEGGVDWRDAIVENLISSDMLVILFSEECNASKQLKKELALADEMDKNVVPVLIEDTKPKGHFLYELAARNWVQIFPNADQKIDDLADRLLHLAESSPGGLSGVKPAVVQDTPQAADISSAAQSEQTSPAAAAPVQAAPSPIVDPTDLEARREALKREEALLKIAEKKAKTDAKLANKATQKSKAKAPRRGKVKTQYRNFLPFKWIDVLLILPIVYLIGEETGGGFDHIDFFDISEMTEVVAFLSVGLAGVGALLFPIRYFMRNLRMKEAAKEYAKSSLVLYALLWAAGLTYATIEGDLENVVETCFGFGALWIGFGVGAFALYGLMHFQRTLRNFNSNVDKI